MFPGIRVLWCITLVVLVSSVESNGGKYIFMLPKTLRPDVDYFFSGQNLGTQTINVISTLETGTGTVLASKTTQLVSTYRIRISTPASLPSGSDIGIRIKGSGGATFNKFTRLTYEKENMAVLIQTDKQVYKPGQTVRYRVFAVKPDLTTYRGEFSVTIQDPRKNKLAYFTRYGDEYGVLEDALKLTSEPVFGNWKITVSTDTVTEIQTFSIERYVLPRAKAKVSLPSYLTVSENSVKVKVSGKYTHGKPLQGSATLQLMVGYYWSSWTNSLRYNLTLVNGEASVVVSKLELQGLRPNLYYKTIFAKTNVTDAETGTVYQSKVSSAKFYRHKEVVKFAMDPKNFKPVVTNAYYVEVTDRDGKPLVGDVANVTITGKYKTEDPPTTLAPPTTYPANWTGSPTKPPPTTLRRQYGFWYGYGYNTCPVITYTWHNITSLTQAVPENGLLKFDIVVNDPNALQLDIKAKYDNRVYTSTILEVTRSPSNTFLSIQLLTLDPKVNEYANFEISSNIQFNTIYYFILAKGQIQYTKRKVFPSSKKTQMLKLRIFSSFRPNVRIVVYLQTTNKEIVADAITFSVKGDFNNKVSIQFNKNNAEPGDQTQLSIKARAYSNVYALAVDKSTTLLGGTQTDMAEEVRGFIGGLDTGSIPTYRNWGYRKKRSAERSARTRRSMPYFYYPIFSPGTDVDEIFKYNGINVITDALIYQYTPEPTCLSYYYLPPAGIAPTTAPGTTPPIEDEKKPSTWENSVKTRSYFPETWVWDSKKSSYDGFANFTLTVPDTITSWVSEAFAIHSARSVGIGFTDNPALINVYRDFFVTLNLPYSIIRGEEVLIQAIVFNYLDQDIQATVTLENPTGYVIMKLDSNGNFVDSSEDETRTVWVSKDRTSSVYFAVKAVDLGSLDILVYAKSVDQQAGDRLLKTLLVEPEGIASEYSQNILLDLHNETDESILSAQFPNNCVAGSQRIILTAYGDMMAKSLSNLKNLLKMPCGCGEQNMVKLVPNILTRKYLDSVNALTDEIKTTTDYYMQAGYAREINYRRPDGSFSAFGDADANGSQWLTAYVIRSFADAKEYIYVDDNILRTAADYISNNQHGNGTFHEPGRVFNRQIGKSLNGIALTAFTVLALNDVVNIPGIYVSPTVLSNAIGALITESSTMNKLYDMAITAYAIVTSGNQSLADSLLIKLENLKTVEGVMVYWEIKQTYTPYYHWSPPVKNYNSPTVECTAYMLLIYAHTNELVKGIPVMNWLLQQQSANGGFVSTSDTVVALQALSEFAALVYDKDVDVSLMISASQSVQHWRITKTDAMVQRKWVITDPPENITIKADGTGKVFFSALVKCNVEHIVAQTAFSCRVQVLEESIEHLKVQVCSEYTVPGLSSGMTIFDVAIVSGFTLEDTNLNNNTLIKRHELGFRKVVLYFDEITNNSTCVEINLKRSDKIGKAKPAYVSVYDYYDPDNKVTTFYQATNASQMEVCDSCTDNCDVCDEAKARRRRRR